jgi:hypothetical protein
MTSSTRRFIHIPKTGGRAVIQYLHDNNVDFVHGIEKRPGVFVRKHGTADFWINEPLEKFAVVRNPHTRLVSYYRYVLNRRALTCSFTDFVVNRVEPDPDLARITSPWISQLFWLLDSNNNLIVDQVFCFETLEHDLQQYFNLTTPMPQINITNHTNQDLMEWYTPETLEIVKNHFAKDFEFIDQLG